MHLRRTLLTSLLVSLAVFAVYSWPLARYATEGIPSSAHNAEKDGVRAMIHGDHLQLLYYFWLYGDMLAHQTPWLHDLYQFNTGDDSGRLRLPYFFPFTLCYALISYIASRALAWNLTCLISLWISYLFTWLLLRRLGARDLAAAVVALVALLFPFRWFTLLGGSPTGFAMAWVPVAMYGLDVAARDDRLRGGWVAGVAILFAALGDPHIFFFTTLLLPCWCVVSLLLRTSFAWRRWSAYLRTALAFAPAVLLALPAVAFNFQKSRRVASQTIAQARSWFEVAIFSPRPEGLWTWAANDSAEIYLGYTMLALFAVSGVLLLAATIRRPRENARAWAAWCLLAVGIAAVVALALGPYGPFDALVFRAARKLIPPWAMIRQPSKIFSILPYLLAAAAGLALSRVAPSSHTTRFRMVLLGIGLLMTVEYQRLTHATVCLLDDDQPAYAATVSDTGDPHVAVRALVVPLWPGDSAWSSLYQHYASLYRIRMVNGYSPLTPASYFDKVFRKYQSVNQGVLANEQLDDLLASDVRYILLHEDAFPEKVSPFPVYVTLRSLLAHPRLALLAHAQTVWAFKILDAPSAKPAARDAPYFFPTRRYELERAQQEGGRIDDDSSASGNAFLELETSNAWVRTRATRVSPAPALRWLVRGKGEGDLDALVISDKEAISHTVVPVAAAEWQWYEIPVRGLGLNAPLALRLSAPTGAVALDQAILAAGAWRQLPQHGRITIPAAAFFHNGYTDLATRSVTLRPRYEPAEAINVYGPYLPLDPGRYEVELAYDSPATAGTRLGRMRVSSGGMETSIRPVDAGAPARVEFTKTDNQLLRIDFIFARNAAITIHHVRIRRL